MGFVLTVLYLFIHYLTPAYLLGPLADLRIEVIIVALAALVSVPALLRSSLPKQSQTIALFGLGVAVFLSFVFGMHWISGGWQAVLAFVPNIMAYFLVCLHVNSTKKFKILVLTLLTVCLIVIAHGAYDLMSGAGLGDQSPEAVSSGNVQRGATSSPFLMRQYTNTDQATYRVQGLGEISDPNDLGQLIVCTVPLLFILWQKKKNIANTAFVIVPLCLLLVGVYLTHSRGALVALTVMAIVAARRRIGTIRATLLGCLMFVVAMALQFTGGRDISASAGQDRTGLWGEGMYAFRDQPLFGVGYGHLVDHTQANLTAHNSVIVCAAELGIFGLFFWSLYLFATMRDALTIASPGKLQDEQPITEETAPLPHAVMQPETIDKDEIYLMGRAMMLSLTGFLAAGWFLSRAFVTTLFLLGGMAEAIYEMALRRGMIVPRLKLTKVIPYSGVLALSLLLMMYIVIRILNLIR